ncbi:unnamed protein product (macronuclear) [Paramecium tetraurelia]|uniref:MORN repeat protein n=1 Tax=Paramecium tetraurelia TaxID=5888 RepID=A0CCT5_PARTE|nr:uncharacterized protein GSPATT00037387001 [Paramecium tetraurelia]CAK68602.1 unnamed protein product [Paramecium tetraurelia]|eukprot:XP_001435999.1 hypothetical protein (macronuclear) [Paramecium tetraurelia strain d4-2]
MDQRIQQLEQCILQLQFQILINNIQVPNETIPEYLRIIEVPAFVKAKLKSIRFNPQYEAKDAIFKNATNIGINRVYQGYWQNEKQNGRGQEFNDQEKKFFYGYWQNGVFVQGLIITENFLFEGDAKDEQFLEGVLVFSDKRVFKGKFVQQALNDDEGEYLSKTEKYKGGFKNGMKHGKGKLENENFTYEGAFVNDKICGQGILIEKANGWRQEGLFNDGKLNGKGVYIRSLGDYYEGDFKEGQRHGKGTLKRDGIIYQGNYIEGLLDGWVQMTQEKRIFKCFFEKGEEDKNKRSLVQ